MPISEIDVINAASRLKIRVQKGEDYDDSFSIVANSFKLTVKEMDKLSKILPCRSKTGCQIYPR